MTGFFVGFGLVVVAVAVFAGLKEIAQSHYHGMRLIAEAINTLSKGDE